MQILAHLLSRVIESPWEFEGTPCWVWTRCTVSAGYGRVVVHGKHWLVHRLVFVLTKGPINKGMELHHKCETKGCCNPDHLKLVTRKEHAALDARKTYLPLQAKKAGETRGVQQLSKTHCCRNHKWTPENTRIILGKKGKPERRCKTCCKFHKVKARNRGSL